MLFQVLNFHETLNNHKFNVVKFLSYPDHYDYSTKDIRKIKQIAKTFKAKIITTEKDYLRFVKITGQIKRIIYKQAVDIIDAEVGHTSPDELTFDYDNTTLKYSKLVKFDYQQQVTDVCSYVDLEKNKTAREKY